MARCGVQCARNGDGVRAEGDCAWWTVDGGVRGVSPLDLTSERQGQRERGGYMPARCHGCTLHTEGAPLRLLLARPCTFRSRRGRCKMSTSKKGREKRDHNATLCGHFRRLSRPRARPTVAEKASPSPSKSEAHAQSARDAPGAVGGSVGHRRWPSKVRLVESLMLTARSGTARPRRAHCGSSCP